MRTPETLTAAERAERLRTEAEATAGHKNAQGKSPEMNKKSPNEKDKARASLMSGLDLQASSASAELNPRLDVDGSFSILRIDDVISYKNNPRHSKNPKYEDIKESIRAEGITNTLTVTRRPGEEKYFPYGGGNTRLQIARELSAEGDARFSTLKVLIKAWTSESDVLAAHMAENVNRGDTTFWDNAQGVAAFKREWEQEHPGRTIVGSELNQQLRLAGVNYGIRTIQNYTFAADYLAPVGPWLRADSLNAIIRPELSRYIELAGKLDRMRQASAHLREAMDSHASDLDGLAQRKIERDPDDRVAVELVPDELVQEAAMAIAQGLDMPVKRMQALAQVLQERPRLSTKELLALDLTSPAPERPGRSASFAPAAQPAASAPPAESDGPNEPVVSRTESAGHPPTQVPLGAMVGVVAGTETLTAATAQTPPQEQEEPDAAERLHEQLILLLTAIDQQVPIADCILAAPTLPFGYLIDLPDQHIHMLGDQELPADQAQLREALWWLLVVLSGQTQGPIYLAVRDEPTVRETRWASALALSPKAMSDELGRTLGQAMAVYGGTKTAAGAVAFEVFVASMGIWTLMAHSGIGPLISQLMGLLTRMRASAADGAGHTGHIELPEWDETMLA